MNQDRFQEAKRIYSSALERELEQRQAYLDEACAGDASLRKEVESLLACQPEAKEFFGKAGKVGTGSPVPDFGDRGACPTFPDLTGRTLLHYAITDKIGQGGMGVVYKARDLHLDRSVAIKILPTYAMADPERKRRFVQEAKAASALNHPNVVQIHDISSDAGVDFIAMEYVPGKTLDQRIGRKGLPVNEVLKYGVQVADALAAAHAAGIVHRDLKPANVMVTEKGLVKVLDFGLAKLIQPTSDDLSGNLSAVKTLTEEGRILGTVAYMSPEQAEGKAVDARSDIFSLGSVLYEMATGRHPFRRDSSASTLAAILREEPRPVREWSGPAPKELERIINRCLRKDPGRRFQFMADLKVELEEVLQEIETHTTDEAAPRYRWKWGWSLGLAAAVALIAAAVWYSAYRTPPPPAATTVVPLTTFDGDEDFPCFSPDGSQVAFAWNGEKQDNVDIYVKLVDSPDKPLRLTTDPAPDVGAAWSPDGRQIAFYRVKGEVATIWLISPLGGPERKPADPFPFERRFGTPMMSWSPDGKWLAAGSGYRDTPGGIFLIPIDRGTRQRITLNAVAQDTSPAFSPDGRFLAYASFTGSFSSDIRLVELDSDYRPRGTERQLTHQGAFIRGIAWAADGQSIVYSASLRVGTEHYLWRVAVSGSAQPERLELAGLSATYPDVSPMTHRLAYVRGSGDTDIWRLQYGALDRNFISSTMEDYNAQFSPDGKRIAFSSSRSGRGLAIWTCDQDRSNPVQLTVNGPGRIQGTPRWSPDSRWIAFDSQGEDGHVDVYVIDAAGGQARRLTEFPTDESVPSWSRDGKWIYFRSNRSGRDEIWRIPVQGGEATQVTDNGGYVAFESWDGKTLYYLKNGRGTGPLFARLHSGGPERQILDSVFSRAFCVVEDGIYYIAAANEGGAYPLRFFHFATRKEDVLTSIEAIPLYGLTVSPDRNTLLFSAYKPLSQDLMLIENFR